MLLEMEMDWVQATVQLSECCPWRAETCGGLRRRNVQCDHPKQTICIRRLDICRTLSLSSGLLFSVCVTFHRQRSVRPNKQHRS